MFGTGVARSAGSDCLPTYSELRGHRGGGAVVDGWRYDFGSFRSGLGLPSHKLCGDPTDMDKRGDALAQEGH